MNTKKIENESTPKGGKDNTRVVLTAAGAVAVGAGAGMAIGELDDDNFVAEKEEQTQNNTEEQKQEENTQEQQTQHTQQQAQQQQQQPHPQQVSNNGPTPIATDNNTGGNTNNTGGSTNNTGGNTNNTGGNTNNDNGDVDTEALAVAERLVGSDDIDPNDIDGMVNVNFEDTDVLYTEDGSEIPVAIVSTPDGGQYMLADVDGDRVYDVVLDNEGEIIASVEAGLNTNDAQIALDDDGGYLAISDDDPIFNEDNVNEDIIALNTPQEDNNSVMEEFDDEGMDGLFEDGIDETDLTANVTEVPGLDIADDPGLESDLLDA